MNWATATSGFDEVFDAAGLPRPHYAALISILESFTREDVDRRERLQKLALMNQGITFTVYGEKDGLERIFPFDFVPRIIPAPEWKTIQDGLVQRITTLNLFLLDVYQQQRCLKDGIIPPELVLSRKEYKRELLGLVPPRKVFTHVVGTDLIRSETGEYLVLEDNCRCPSGVSYVLENRTLLNRVFPEFFAVLPRAPGQGVPDAAPRQPALRGAAAEPEPGGRRAEPGHPQLRLLRALLPRARDGRAARRGARPPRRGQSRLHAPDARQAPGRRDLPAHRRRLPRSRSPSSRNSLLGVPGLVNVYREGNVALANAPGAGVADDKAVYAFMPELTKYYLGEEPLLGQVPTYVGFRKDDFRYMTEHLDELVVKTTGDAGGYGMLMGPFASKKERETYLVGMKKNPGNYIAQPLVHFSSHPTHGEGRFEPRRIDLRPFILYGDRIRVLPGGLTRVALRPGSFVVNSSQGGGSKDTWVLAPREP